MQENNNSTNNSHLSKKYDRQIRLWGEQGQKRLQEANICLLNCGPTGSETLKNLVLGNISKYTLVDNKIVTERDLTNNFLITGDSLGKSRAESVHLGLQELNQEVVGSFEDVSAEDVISQGVEFFKNFSMIIATQLSEQECVKLEKICLQIQTNVSLLIVRSYGLVGYLRICKRDHCVIESRPDHPILDLRLSDPWPELLAYAQSFELDKLDNLTHKHIPYAILLILVTLKWKDSHDGQLPQNYQQQKQFKQLIEQIRRHEDENGKLLDEENVDEAIQSAQLVWSRGTEIPENIKQLLQEAENNMDLQNSSEFWVVLEAIRMFVENEGKGKLPLEGSIPDMVATTDIFVKLQSLYREKALKDVEYVMKYARQISESIGKQPPSFDFIKLMCKNSRNLNVVRFKKLEEFRENHQSLQYALNSKEEKQNATIYLLFRAIDRFKIQNQRFPGCEIAEISNSNSNSNSNLNSNFNWQEDENKLIQIADALAWEMGVGGIELDKDMALEMCRFGASELHNVGAFMGGVAAQEAIKIITEQFIPLSGTFIYNGVKQTTSTF